MIRGSVVTALLVVALLVSALFVIDAVANPVDHAQLDGRLTRIEQLMEEAVCLLEAGPDRTPSEVAACRV